MSNCMVANNSDGIYLEKADTTPSDTHIIKNSVFLDNDMPEITNTYPIDLSGEEDAIVTIDNNYIDNYNIYIQYFSSNNILVISIKVKTYQWFDIFDIRHFVNNHHIR